jgi:hypothetical protein
MRRTFITVVGIVLIVSVSSPKAAGLRVFGVAEDVVDTSLRITRGAESSQTVTTDGRTTYMKWHPR